LASDRIRRPGLRFATLPLLQHQVYRLARRVVILAALTADVALLPGVRPREVQAPQPKAKPQSMRALLDVCRNRAFRKTIMVVLVSHTIYWGIQGLWIGRWLSDVAHFSEAAVAYLLYLSMAAVIFGAIAVGMITEWAGRRGIVPLDVAAIGVAGFVLVQCAIVLNHAPSFKCWQVYTFGFIAASSRSCSKAACERPEPLLPA
jgi:predicted MFS family arabinose efflux permease